MAHLPNAKQLTFRVDEALPAASVAQGRSQDSAEEILKTALEGLGGIARFVKPGQVVAIKPNATWAFPPKTASSTDPDLLRALIRLVQEAGASRVIVMDHCAIDPGTAEALRVSGIGDVVNKLNVEKVFPDRYLSPKEGYVNIELPRGKAFTKVGVIKAAVEADVRINLAVAKCHVVTKYTLCLKHMMGFLQFPNALHTQLEQGITDINTVSPLQAHLHILEAIRVRLPMGSDRTAGGFETDLTHPNKVKRFNEVVAGTDPVLVDAYGCEAYFGIRPDELTHLQRAAESGLGESDVRKATEQGLLRIFKVGQPVRTPTASVTATRQINSSATPGVPTLTGPAPTQTPLPTATPPTLPQANQASSDSGSSSCQPEIFSLPSLLNGWLLPVVAALVVGVSWVVRRRLAREKTDRANI